MSADQPQQPVAPAQSSGLPVTDRGELEALRAATLGDYDIAGELGRGGMATVYLAHDIALDRKVAIKVMSPVLSLGDGVERFRREAKTAASLSHPNIIPIYAVRHSEHLLYFVMKYVEGRSLDSIIRELGPLPIPMVQAILGQTASAFGYAHRRGVIHRDIKPGNILIDDEGWAVVTDFGIAKVSEAEQLTGTGLSVGTPTYMSPEQVAAQAVTGASDQYSLGVVAYEMLTGKPPFHGGGMMAMMYAHVHQEPVPMETVRPDCPEGLRVAVMRMMAKDPAERWPSVEDVIAAIGSPTLTPDDPTRSQLIAIAKTGQRRAIGVTTPKSPIPLLRTPLPLAATPRTGGIATGTTAPAAPVAVTPQGGVDAAASAAKPAVPLLAAIKARLPLAGARARSALTAFRARLAAITARLPLTRRTLAMAGGGVLAAAAIILAVIKARPSTHAGSPPDSGAVPEAVATPPSPVEVPSTTAPQPAAEPPVAEALPATGPAAPAPKKSPAGKSAAANKAKTPVAAPESVATAPPPPTSVEPTPEPAQPAPVAAAPAPAARSVSGASALLGNAGAPAAAQPRTTPADRKAVELAVRSYSAALEAGSAARARQAFPGMSSAQLTNFEAFFGSGGRMQTDWKVSDVTVDGDQATARVRGTTRTTPGGGNPALDTVDVRAGLERGSDGWRLRSFGGHGAR
jgi:serine/threonine-protein kinase